MYEIANIVAEYSFLRQWQQLPPRIDRASPIMLFIMAVFLVTTNLKAAISVDRAALKRLRRIEPIHGVKMALDAGYVDSRLQDTYVVCR